MRSVSKFQGARKYETLFSVQVDGSLIKQTETIIDHFPAFVHHRITGIRKDWSYKLLVICNDCVQRFFPSTTGQTSPVALRRIRSDQKLLLERNERKL